MCCLNETTTVIDSSKDFHLKNPVHYSTYRSNESTSIGTITYWEGRYLHSDPSSQWIAAGNPISSWRKWLKSRQILFNDWGIVHNGLGIAGRIVFHVRNAPLEATFAI